MFCPQCKTEYREGFRRCADCGSELVYSLPVEPPTKTGRLRASEWVTVLESIDPGIMMVAKSILEGAGIPYFARGEDIQGLFGIGQITFNPLIGVIKLQVDQQDFAVAKALLQEMPGIKQTPSK